MTISAAASSREHAPWALLDFGFRCIIAPSFADIFYNNCFKNGILPIRLPQSEIDKLLDDASRGANATITIDLPNQEIRGPDGGVIRFDIDPFLKRCLMEGLDDIGLTLEKAHHIEAFETEHRSPPPLGLSRTSTLSLPGLTGQSSNPGCDDSWQTPR